MKRFLELILCFVLCLCFFSCADGLNSLAGYTENEFIPSPATPSNLKSAVEKNSVTLTWSSVTYADSYQVYVADGSANNDYVLVEDEITDTKLVISNVARGYHYYKVKAKNKNGVSDFSSIVYAYVYTLSAPVISTNNVASNTVSLTWSSISGASSYAVYHSTTSSGTYTKVTTVTTCSVTLKDVGYGTHYYKVTACTTGVESDYSSAVTVGVSTLLAPKNITSSNSGSTVNLKWDSVDGATYYMVYASSSSYGVYTALSGTVTTAGAKISNVSSGVHYYKIKACNSSTSSELSDYKYVYVSY